MGKKKGTKPFKILFQPLFKTSEFCELPWWLGTSLVVQMVKRLPTMRETQVRSLGQEDPLQKEMATHSSTLAWKIPWMEESHRLQSMGSQRVGDFTFTFTLKEERKFCKQKTAQIYFKQKEKRMS